MTWDQHAKSLAPEEDFLSVPIFILNFNQVSYLRKQLDWLLTRGYRHICVIDNNSTYPPLLDFYRELGSNPAVHLVRREQNSGKLALWEEDVLRRLGVTGPFVYTDSDVVPDDECPADVVAHLAFHLRQNPQIFKAGLGLRLDDLPGTYQFRDNVMAWESQFWRAPAARGLFLATIDTTFALYRPQSEFALSPALRTGWPYLARHEPWYADSDNPTAELLYYRDSIRTTGRGHWGRARLPEWLEAVSTVRSSLPAPKLLHLGCGRERLPSWINLDVSPDVRPDVVFDLETCAQRRLPFDDDSIDGMFMCHVFEHIDRTLPMMQELYRVAKPNARFVIRLPHGASDGASEDPTHKRPYFPNSFVYFAQPAYSRADYNYTGDWRISRARLVVDPDLLKAAGEARVLDRIRRERNIVQELIIELQAVKPPRPRQLRLLEWPTPTCVGTAIDTESVF